MLFFCLFCTNYIYSPFYATRDTLINKGDRICQFEIVPIMPEIFVEEVNEFDSVDRGGFGSAGK